MSYGRPPPDVEGMTSLKVDNLTYRTSPETLRRVFEKYGRVGDVYIPRDRYTKESRGFAFVRFHDKRDAEDAMDAMDGALLDGRELRVQMARYGRPPDSHYSRRGAAPRRSGGYGRRSRSRSPRRRRHSRSRSRSHSRSRSRYSRSRSRSESHSRSRSKSQTPRRSKSKSPSRSRSRSKSKSRSRSHTPRSNKGSKSRSRSRSRPKSPEDKGANAES
ncbi:serine/arginine-rich splicing factor 2-like [Xyrauchen texanus]|uniref:serine/arginine-rich splicing factor 2-like n=1 Tax=Xyrauchen texanus TaxID=154827 RepID=UPI002241B2FD|nr:serine/arginine-rich splicing factor 2-like [Xyrauchen texanus]XP_051968142.1 serine/arginine-rich splicing factor 2-like [Xyrauchen texanus]XP_051968143.1 serine/arginine-rich splicing factor 2-like [Xyrauchen texanus]